MLVFLQGTAEAVASSDVEVGDLVGIDDRRGQWARVARSIVANCGELIGSRVTVSCHAVIAAAQGGSLAAGI